MICKKHGETNFGIWTSSTTGKTHYYCKTCRQARADTYSSRVRASDGNHTYKQWTEKLKLYNECPGCLRNWKDIPNRPDKRYKYVWTKDHILPLGQGGTDSIDNIQPLCYRCNFAKR